MFKSISLLAIFFLMALLNVNGQSGKFLIGGKMGFSFSSQNPVSANDVAEDSKYKTVSFSGAPVFGYFITQNIMAGIDFEFLTENTNMENGLANTKTKSLTLNPLVRFYFNSPFFTEARFTWGTNSTDYDFSESAIPVQDIKITSKTLGVGAGLGYDVKLAEKVSLEPLIYYRWNTYKTEELETKSNQSHIFFNLGLVFRL